MSESAALVPVRKETVCTSLVLFPWPHNPHLRHSLAVIEPGVQSHRQNPIQFARPLPFTLCGNKQSTVEEARPVTDTTTQDALRAEADDDLLIRYQQLDDHDAFAELDRRYHNQLLNHVNHWGGGVLRGEAGDIVQDAFLEFHKHRKEFAPEKGVHALLFKITRRCCTTHVKRAAAEKRNYQRTCSLSESVAESHADPKADPAHWDAAIEVKEHMARLPVEEARAVQLVDIEEHTQASAAEAANLPLGTFKDQLHRGRQRFKEVATTTLILFALVGAVADNCNLDGCMNLVSAENDDDEVCREDSGHHDSDKQRRKGMKRLLTWPDTVEVDPNMTEVVNARNESYDVLIARPSKWGNPFQIGRDGDRERVICMYEVHFRRRPDLLAALPELAGKRLGCYCKPEACHGDVLVKLLRELFLEV